MDTAESVETSTNESQMTEEINVAIQLASQLERELILKKNSLKDSQLFKENPDKFKAAASYLLQEGHSEAVQHLSLGLLDEGVIDADIINFLGRAFFEQELFDMATKAFQLGIMAEPEDQRLVVNCASSLAEEGKLDEALDLLNSVIVKDTDNPTVYINRGIILEKKGDMALACEDYEHALLLDPEATTTGLTKERLKQIRLTEKDLPTRDNT